MSSRRVPIAVSLPVIAAAFGMGVVASFWQDEIADLLPDQDPPAALPQASGVQTPPATAHSGLAAPHTPVQRISVELPPNEAPPHRTNSAEVETDAPTKESARRPVRQPDDAAPMEAPDKLATRGSISAPPSGLVVPLLAPVALPTAPPEDLKPGPEASARSAHHRARAVRKRPAPKKKSVPILGTLFGLKY